MAKSSVEDILMQDNQDNITCFDAQDDFAHQTINDVKAMVYAGKLESLAISAVTNDGEVFTTYNYKKDASLFSMLGGIHYLLDRILEQIRD